MKHVTLFITNLIRMNFGDLMFVYLKQKAGVPNAKDATELPDPKTLTYGSFSEEFAIFRKS